MPMVRDMMRLMPTDPAQPQSSQSTPSTVGGGSLNRELEGGIAIGETPGLKDISGKEVALPKEVASAGVRVHPTSVTIPPNVTQLGVKPSGTSTPVATGSSVVLPLTDDQISQGLSQSVTSSWRWLAEWCVRKIKQIHKSFKKVKSS